MALLPQDPKKQRLILIGALPLIGLFAYWYFLYGKTTQEIDQLRQHVEDLDSRNAAAKAVIARGGHDLKNKLALYEEHMRRLEQLVPKSEEVPELLHAMTERADEAGVELSLVRPEAAEPGAYYTKQTYDMSVYGAYANVGRFLAAVGSLPRIITPLEITLRPRNETEKNGLQRLEADFKIETYVIPAPKVAPSPVEKSNVKT